MVETHDGEKTDAKITGPGDGPWCNCRHGATAAAGGGRTGTFFRRRRAEGRIASGPPIGAGQGNSGNRTASLAGNLAFYNSSGTILRHHKCGGQRGLKQSHDLINHNRYPIDYF